MTSCDAIYAVVGLGPVAFVSGLLIGATLPWPTPNLGRKLRHGRIPH